LTCINDDNDDDNDDDDDSDDDDDTDDDDDNDDDNDCDIPMEYSICMIDMHYVKAIQPFPLSYQGICPI
jgi:hypothetical protein